MTKAQEISLSGEKLLLLPEGAIFWGRRGTLFVADLHLGKGDTFRKNGVPVPTGTTKTDLDRLTRVIKDTKTKRLVVLGDLLHASASLSYTAITSFGAWRRTHPDLQIVLVRGNHDLVAGDPPDDWQIESLDPGCVSPPFVLHHEPPDSAPEVGYALCGHLHPAARLRGKGDQELILPCFWFGKFAAVLPAFGSFTGHRPVRAHLGEQVYVIADGKVIAMNKR